MSCESPLLAYSYYRSDIGKYKLSFKTHSDDNVQKLSAIYGAENVFELPCGKCESCRKDYARQWSYRLTMERPYWNYAYFITLTYDDKFLPFADYSDIQKFIKNVRNQLGSCAYFGCIEKGELTDRTHYHLILFLQKPLDLYHPVRIKNNLHFHSKFISKYWFYGDNHDVSEFSHYCGAYVAKYTTKDGSCFMSRNIGKRYFLDNYQKIVDDNFVIYGRFGSEDRIPVPKFMIQWFKELDDLTLDDYKKARSELVHLFISTQCRSIQAEHVEILRQQKSKSSVKKRGDF